MYAWNMVRGLRVACVHFSLVSQVTLPQLMQTLATQETKAVEVVPPYCPLWTPYGPPMAPSWTVPRFALTRLRAFLSLHSHPVSPIRYVASIQNVLPCL